MRALQMDLNSRRQILHLGVAVAVLALCWLPIDEASAQDPGDVIQENVASAPIDEPHGVSVVEVEFPDPPTEGNLLIAMSGHRIDWLDAEMLSDGWSVAVQRNDEEFDTESRRGLTMWYKIAGPNEAQSVVTQWGNSADDRDHYDDPWVSGPRHSMTVIQEIHGNFPILDVTNTASSFDDDVNEVSTGTTPVSQGSEKVIVGAVLSRENADQADWSGGTHELFAPSRYQVMELGSGAPLPFTLQTARRFADEQNSWEGRAEWGGDAGGAFGMIAVFSDSIAGEYYFGPHCAPTMEHTPEEGRDPAALLMLDRSLSMQALGTSWDCSCPDWAPGAEQNSDGDYCGYCDGTPLWDIAKGAIDQTVNALHEDLFFGLGTFAGGAYQSVEVDIHVEASEDSWTEIEDILNAYSPYDGTPTAEAFEEMRESDTMNSSDLSAAGVMITDGYPLDPGDALQEACDSRFDDGHLNHVVGLGYATDTDYNNLLAAAAGTGCCGYNAENGCPGGIDFDPCDHLGDWESLDDTVCAGSALATSEDQFREILTAIGEDIACTFDVDDQWWWDGVPDDPGVARIQIFSEDTGTWDEVPHVSEIGGLGDYEACPDTDEYCLPGGRCRNTDEYFACSQDSDCDDTDDFCHEFLGCQRVGDWCDDANPCDDGFCWHHICVENAEDGAEDELCQDDSDCHEWEGDDYVCHDGYCRFSGLEGWCPYDEYLAGDWDCPDQTDYSSGGDYCHPISGCVGFDEYYCESDSDCGGGEYCWLGKCANNSDYCDAPTGGWHFANTERNQVTLTGEYCEELGSGGGDGHYTGVQTQLACNCYSMYEGAPCPCAGEGDITQPPWTNPGQACPSGEYECANQMDNDPACDDCGTGPPIDPCPFFCEEHDDIHGMPCDADCEVIWDWIIQEITIICDGELVDPDDLIAAGVNRCEPGNDEILCEGTSPPVCEEPTSSARRPMPEVCDGLDNSCDGEVDNIAQSWEDFRECEGVWEDHSSPNQGWDEDAWGPNPCGEPGYPWEIEDVSGAWEGAACYEQDFQCSCPQGSHIHQGDGATYFDEFQDYLQSWTPEEGCYCTAQ